MKIGIYLCECGPNIKDGLDFDSLLSYAASLPGVFLAKPFRLLCSEEGKTLIASDIQENNLTHIVIAACSPKEHELTFRKVLQMAGLNPYMLQVANIREHCTWVIKDKQKATEVAKAALSAAYYRVKHHNPIESKEIDCIPDALVIGAGVAGLSAALCLAQKCRKVYLVEKSACIGGKATRYEEIGPGLECAPCMMEPKLDQVLHNEHIDLLTLSEVKQVLGAYGNYQVSVHQQARGVSLEACIGCGACIEACPVKVRNEFNQGLDERKAVYFPYPGALPNAPTIDKANCLRYKGKECSACKDACAFAAVDYEQKDDLHQIKVGAIVLASGFELFDPCALVRLGYGKLENVLTGLEFERLLSSTGPTGGKLQLKDGSVPKRIALINCVGSRNEKYNHYCSAVCCSYMAKFSHQIKHKAPETQIIQFYSELCLPGKQSQKFFDEAKKGMKLMRVSDTNSIEIRQDSGDLEILCANAGQAALNQTFEVVIKARADMVVLATAIVGAPIKELAGMLDLEVDGSGFVKEEHQHLGMVSTTNEGVFIAGCCQSPQNIASSSASGQAAAAKILSRLVPGEKLILEPCISVVDKDKCSGCKTCIGLCPYNAISFKEQDKTADISDVLCRGCGVCAGACPSGAISSRNFTDKQIMEEIKGLMKQ